MSPVSKWTFLIVAGLFSEYLIPLVHSPYAAQSWKGKLYFDVQLTVLVPLQGNRYGMCCCYVVIDLQQLLILVTK